MTLAFIINKNKPHYTIAVVNAAKAYQRETGGVDGDLETVYVGETFGQRIVFRDNDFITVYSREAAIAAWKKVRDEAIAGLLTSDPAVHHDDEAVAELLAIDPAVHLDAVLAKRKAKGL